MRSPLAGSARATLLLLAVALLSGSVPAQHPNACDEPGDAPDVVVGALQGIIRHGSVGEITAYSVGTTSCNLGTCWLNWISSTNEHPVIGQNLYRLEDGRYEQIGQSWLKHGFFALSENLCSNDCIPTNGSHLGVNCSDPYSAETNGNQARLGPKSEVNPSTGVYPYPFGDQGAVGDAIYKRLQVHHDDLDPALNAGARYFLEGQYVTADDTAAGNGTNNASYNEVSVLDRGGDVYDLAFVGQTFPGRPAIEAWESVDSDVSVVRFSVPGDGMFLVAARVTDLGGGSWHYEYAVQNLTSHRSAMSLAVPVSPGAAVGGVGFHDVDYHSGEPFDGTDWPASVDAAAFPGTLRWSSATHAENLDANALRWGTLYNFRFDVDAAPKNGEVTLGLFRPGDPASVQIATLVPGDCNGDGVCGPGEDCNNCVSDCPGDPSATPFCGDASCQPSIGEDCLSCPQDCNGGTGFCCGDGDGPVDCTDPRCSFPGFSCGVVIEPFCCGDEVCDPGEDPCNCAGDCGLFAFVESSCDDGLDDDCDGAIDCADADCCSDALCDDGVDGDADGVASCDCDDADGSVWLTPSELGGLSLSGGGVLEWSAPFEPGASSHDYELLRADGSTGFASPHCVPLADPQIPAATDPDLPLPGGVFHYLVRAVNGCPADGGVGSLGSRSSGAGRAAAGCP